MDPDLATMNHTGKTAGRQCDGPVVCSPEGLTDAARGAVVSGSRKADSQHAESIYLSVAIFALPAHQHPDALLEVHKQLQRWSSLHPYQNPFSTIKDSMLMSMGVCAFVQP